MYIASRSAVITKIHQSIQSTKDLLVSSILYGEEYCGKKTLLSQIYKSAFWVSGKNLNEVKEALRNYNQVVITDFEKIINIDALDFENCNLFAIYNGTKLETRLEDKFAFIYSMPPLRDRQEDIKLFANHYTSEAKDIFDIHQDIKIEKEDIDISQNLKSLKSSIYKAVLFKSSKEKDVSYLLSRYFEKNYSGSNIYKKHLELFERALIETGLKLYGSQLKLSEILGINRNTLRKKINEYF